MAGRRLISLFLSIGMLLPLFGCGARSELRVPPRPPSASPFPACDFVGSSRIVFSVSMSSIAPTAPLRQVHWQIDDYCDSSHGGFSCQVDEPDRQGASGDCATPGSNWPHVENYRSGSARVSFDLVGHTQGLIKVTGNVTVQGSTTPVDLGTLCWRVTTATPLPVAYTLTTTSPSDPTPVVIPAGFTLTCP